ncbi:MAG: sigma-54-dependent Fis family transcriptional regulator [Candidatus Riflebacteria bacterium]|nr:sigma-54-dependent Fis family transcriptional regulator [Candidatus Riflebacteria bacterium]
MNVLIVDDNLSLARGLATFLKQEGHSAAIAASVAEGRALLAKFLYDLVITDLKLPDDLGLELIKTTRTIEPPPEVILMTAYGTIETAVEAMKLGAFDYLTKPVPIEEFAFRINRVARLRAAGNRSRALETANNDLLEAAGLASPLDELTGTSSAITALKEMIRKTAPYPSTVLITGETGSGKELVARALHMLSPRAEKAFVRVNCASISDTLFESELFGHEKGAFTDARERRIGRFEAAEGGTLFLDEVGEVPIHLQAKLLRALQEKEITRVGGEQPIRVDVRIIAATNRDLEKMTKDAFHNDTKAFREDLLYRLSVIRLNVPPLRDRPGDIPAIAIRMLERFGREFGKHGLALSPAAERELIHRGWRGNVRELKNVLERAAVLTEGTSIGIDLIGSVSNDRSVNGVSSQEATAIVPSAGLMEKLAEVERSLIEGALTRAGGVKARAADELCIPRTNLIYRMKRLGLLSENASIKKHGESDAGDTEDR